jgi:NADH dehydrogenase/NADH:ubiquinone oxidoreductase subunit G
MNKLNKTLLLSKTLKIDKYYYPFNKDKDFTLIQLCENVNIFLPRFCYHSELSIAGNCRMCLVEISNSNKPVVACATSLTEGLVVKTNTILIKIIRESILEFLLINHPLDCPICDQGGECDLQDLLVVYGSDRGRFKESKRSVLDKEFGVMIKTIMTRCIHCTRCVRFSSELLGQPYLGAFGRGDSTEIGTYIKRVVDGNLVGNLIDLCPVGAITSKPYAFRARPWELCKTETIDILDSLCSSIRVDTKHNLILRVIPSINPKINDCWITDKIRFSYDSVTNQRLLSPLVLDNESNVVGQS